MSGWRLTLKQTPELRVQADALQPATLAALDEAALLRLALPMARELVPVGELFSLQRLPDGEGAQLEIEGALDRFDRLGAGLEQGRLLLRGNVGHQAGLAMRGGQLRIEGSAGDLAAGAMAGGQVEVTGSVGDFAAAAQPGEMAGMSGGTLVIQGDAGARLADRLRRGTVVLHGRAGDYLASRMVAGTVALGGACGRHPGLAMRRGTLVFAGPQPGADELGPSFVPVPGQADVFWQLMARDLARFGAAFGGLARRPLRRLAGDLAVQGQGELLLPG
jgi:formylmethanofuran dehydrogenase subunit C